MGTVVGVFDSVVLEETDASGTVVDDVGATDAVDFGTREAA